MSTKKLAGIALALIVSLLGAGNTPAVAGSMVDTAREAVRADRMGLTPGQANAVRKAQSYLKYSAFSKSGLADQLEYEGFSTKDATFAVNYIRVSWKQQAYKKAVSYLKNSSFSLSGLIDQLVYEGFTYAQAAYGAKRAY